jgi:hypothetical protein
LEYGALGRRIAAHRRWRRGGIWRAAVVGARSGKMNPWALDPKRVATIRYGCLDNPFVTKSGSSIRALAVWIESNAYCFVDRMLTLGFGSGGLSARAAAI